MGRLTGGTRERPELLVRTADAGATYVSWAWSDRPADIRADRLDPEQWAEALAELTAALPGIPPHRGATAHSLSRTLEGGAFGSSRREAKLAELLGRAVPSRLWRELLVRAGERPVVRLSPSASAARVPWGLVDLDGTGVRLLDVADVLIDPPSLVHRGRNRTPVAETAGPPLWVVDPQLPLVALDGGLSQVIAPADLGHYRDLCDEVESESGAPVGAGGDGARCALRERIGREDLSDALRAGPGRFVYLGHATGSTDQPGASALHLSDTLTPEQVIDGDWGTAQPWSPAMASGRRRPRPGDPLPLTALDLVVGGRLRAPGRRERTGPGHVLWPMPRNVVLLGCESGIDHAAAETFGLTTAAIDSGAEFVTATLWTVPTDAGMRRATGAGPGYRPLAQLLQASDHAHSQDDPGTVLAEWQRARLEAWRETGSVENTPVVWASVTTTHAPADEERS